MNSRQSFDDAHELSRFWDALHRGERNPASGELDPDSIAFVTEFQRAARMSFPAGTGEQALDAVMNDITTRLAAQNGKGTHVGQTVVLVEGVTPRVGTGETRRVAELRSTPRSRGLAWVGAAAIALIMLASFFFIIRDEQKAAMPGLTEPATPSPTIAPTGTGWFSFKGGNARTSAVEGPGPSGELQVLWTIQDPNGSRDPVVSEGSVYTVDRGSDLYAFSADTGEQRWSVHLGFPAPSTNYPSFCSPTVVDGVVYVGSYAGILYALNAEDGSVRWSFPTGSSILTSPVVANGQVVISTDSGLLFAVDAGTGAMIWNYQSDGAFFISAPSFDGSTLIIPNQKGQVVGIDFFSGVERWKTQLDATGATTASIATGVAYMASDNGVLYALNGATGAELWRYETGGVVGNLPAVGNGVVVINALKGVQALDAMSGAALWSGPRIVWQAVIAGNTIYLPTDLGLEERDLRSGNLIASYSLGKLRMTPAIVDGVIYAGSMTGISAYGPKSDAPELVSAVTPPTGIVQTTPISTPDGLRQVAKAEFQWAAYGRPDDPFGEGWLVRVAPDRTIWATDVSKRAFIYNSEGELLDIWSRDGAGPVITFAPDGSFYTVDPESTRIQYYGIDRELIAEIGKGGRKDGQFLNPESLVILPDGTLMISDSERGDVQHLNADGTFLGKFDGSGSAGGVLQSPGMMAIDSHGWLYIVENGAGRIRVFDQSGNELRQIAGEGVGIGVLVEPYDIAIDDRDYLLVADQSNNKVLLLNTMGELAFEWGGLGIGDGQFQKPASVAFGEDSAVYVIDWLGARLEKFTLEGSFYFSPVLN